MAIETILSIKPDRNDLRRLERNVERSLTKAESTFGKTFVNETTETFEREFNSPSFKRTASRAGATFAAAFAGAVALIAKRQASALPLVTSRQDEAVGIQTASNLAGDLANVNEIGTLVQAFERQGFTFAQALSNVSNIISGIQNAELGTDLKLSEFSNVARSDGIIAAVNQLVRSLQNTPIEVAQRQGRGLLDSNQAAYSNLLSRANGLPTQNIPLPQSRNIEDVAAQRELLDRQLNEQDIRAQARDFESITNQVRSGATVSEVQRTANERQLGSNSNVISNSVQLADEGSSINNFLSTSGDVFSAILGGFIKGVQETGQNLAKAGEYISEGFSSLSDSVGETTGEKNRKNTSSNARE